VAKGYTKLIVVMGHESCGAVDEALSDKKEFGSPSLDALVKKIRDNLGGHKPGIERAVEMNAQASAEQLLASEIIRNSKVKIVTVYYAFDGKVRKIE